MTRYEFYRDRHTARIRRSRGTYRCECVDKDGIRCRELIRPNDEYLDTNVLKQNTINTRATKRFCIDCSRAEIY